MSDKVVLNGSAKTSRNTEIAVTLSQFRKLASTGSIHNVIVSEKDGEFTIRFHIQREDEELAPAMLITSGTKVLRVFRNARTYAKMLNETGIKLWKLQQISQ